MTKRVKIVVQGEGVNFGCRGTIAARGKKLWESELLRPASMRHVAYSDAEAEVERRGWKLTESER